MALRSDRALFADRDGNIVAAGDPAGVVQVASRAGKDIPEHYQKAARKFMAENPNNGEQEEETEQAPAEAADEASYGDELEEGEGTAEEEAAEDEEPAQGKRRRGPAEDKARRAPDETK